MIKGIYSEDSLVRSCVFRWDKPFFKGPKKLTDEVRTGRPSTSSGDDKVKHVREILKIDQQIIVRLVVQTLGIPKSIIHEVVTNDLADVETPLTTGSCITTTL